MKKIALTILGLGVILILQSTSSYALTSYIGDADSFGFDTIADFTKLPGADGSPIDRNGNGFLDEGDVLPDFQSNPPEGEGWILDGHWKLSEGSPLPTIDPAGRDGKTQGYDLFDFRSAGEKNATNGTQWTDVSLSPAYLDGPGLAQDALFTFKFDPASLQNDPDAGLEHYISFLYGDYDVGNMTASITFVGSGKTMEIGLLGRRDTGLDGYIGLAYTPISWDDIVSAGGEIQIRLNAPQEPYVAVDFFKLGTDIQQPLPPSPEPVPEPGTLLLLGAGLLGLIGLRRRVKK